MTRIQNSAHKFTSHAVSAVAAAALVACGGVEAETTSASSGLNVEPIAELGIEKPIVVPRGGDDRCAFGGSFDGASGRFGCSESLDTNNDLIDSTRCVESPSGSVCFKGEVQHGPFVRRDGAGRVVEKGQFSNGLRTGTWTEHLFDQHGKEYRRIATEYLTGDELDNYTRVYEPDVIYTPARWVIVEEGGYRDGERQGRWITYFTPDDPDSYYPRRATGLMKEFGSYDQGTKVDEWMTFFIEYDINPQFPGDDLYYLTRRAIDTCPAKIQNHTKGTRWLYFYGSGRSNAEVCNAGLKLIYRYGAKGDHACLDPDGNLMQCPPNR